MNKILHFWQDSSASATQKFETRTNVLNRKKNKKTLLKDIKISPLPWPYSHSFHSLWFCHLNLLVCRETWPNGAMGDVPTAKRREMKSHLCFPCVFNQGKALKEHVCILKSCLCDSGPLLGFPISPTAAWDSYDQATTRIAPRTRVGQVSPTRTVQAPLHLDWSVTARCLTQLWETLDFYRPEAPFFPHCPVFILSFSTSDYFKK